MISATDYRISGHESFPCRYAWLPKAVRGLNHDPKLFSDDEQAMVSLGVDIDSQWRCDPTGSHAPGCLVHRRAEDRRPGNQGRSQGCLAPDVP